MFWLGWAALQAFLAILPGLVCDGFCVYCDLLKIAWAAWQIPGCIHICEMFRRVTSDWQMGAFVASHKSTTVTVIVNGIEFPTKISL